MLTRALHMRTHAVRAFSSRVMKVDNPYTGEIYCTIPYQSDAAAVAAIERAQKAQTSWKKVPLAKRLELVSEWVKAFEKRADLIATDVTNMMGKPLKQAKGEVNTTLDRAKTMMKLAPQVLADVVIPPASGSPNLFRKIVQEPVGVVMSLCPWNYPLICAVNSVIPAIIAGNSVLIKHSDRSPLCADHFSQIFKDIGAPADLIQTLHVDHDQISKLVQHPAISYVAFTGSVGGGHAVYKAVANRFIDAGLELGGKDPAYVAADADIANAADGLVDGAMYNAGQSCCSIERVYVHESKYEEFLEKSVNIAKQYVLGNPLDAATSMGPIAQPAHGNFLEAQVKEAKSLGARVLLGGHKTTDAAGKGRFFAPTVIADCTHKMQVMTEESFGPILAVAPVKSDEEAIKLMNDSKYGLTAAIYTKDSDRAERMATELDAGTIFMNRCDFVDPSLPWSGRKDSGKGISLSQFGFQSLVKTKGYNFRKL